MAMLPSSFRSSDVADDIWPAGDYLVEITKSEMKDTKSKTGKYLSLGFKCIEGKQKGSMVFTNLNLVNDNETAVKIAYSDLKKICTAVGKPNISDSSELHAIPLKIKVTVRPDDDDFPGNDVKKYMAVGKASSSAPKKNPFNK